MNKGLVLFGCLLSNVVIFGGSCCNNNNNKSKSSAESVETKFKKLVCKCFGVQESDIISVKSSDKSVLTNTIFNINEINNSTFLVVHKINGRFVYCIVKGAVNPDSNVVGTCKPVKDKDFKYLEEVFYVHNFRTRVTVYYKLKK